jgi:hypothetical protein
MLSNLFQELPNEKLRTREIYCNQGARSARYYIYKKYHMKVSASDLRDAMEIPADLGALRSAEVHRLAWAETGWYASAKGSVIRFDGAYAGDGNSSSGRGGGKRSLAYALGADVRGQGRTSTSKLEINWR